MTVKDIMDKLKAPFLWINLLAMAAVIVLLCFGVIWGLDLYTNHGEGVEVPDFVGKNYTRAIEVAEEKGLMLVANDSTYIKEMPAGCVVLQQPGVGSQVKEGRIIYVTINSLTLPRVAIPDLIDNSSYREAQAKLLALDFVVLPPKLVEGEKDWVYGIQCDGRSLASGDLVAKESHLTLLIGNGLVGEEADMDEYLEDYGMGRISDEPDDMEEVTELPISTE
ncbi:MAG: PASTA domain-containing protein [Prevotella sp.]|nr:PASTA domain-containing protein [Prevotella sp.]